MQEALYVQRTGQFFIGDDVFACFAGNGGGRNNPAAQTVRSVGPLPVGYYDATLLSHPRFRQPAFRLDPWPATEMYGRSEFWIHGGTVSHGCVIMRFADRIVLPDEFVLLVLSDPAKPGT